jgi:large subunit ribosomal protein L1
MKRSKKYKNTLKLYDKTKQYSLDESLDILPKLNTTKFDSSVEIHINLQLTEKQKKSSIKGSCVLPHQIGKSIKIAVITTPQHEAEAKSADISGSEDLIKKIEKGWSDFDVLIATPEIMPKVAILGKTLGPKGKMPNPKNGTVTTNLKETINNYKKGKTDFKADKQGGIHMKIGKISMKKDELKENLQTFLKSLYSETRTIQVIPFKSITLTPTMGPGIKLNINEILKELT